MIEHREDVVVLSFDLSKLPQLDCMEQEWSDGLLAAMRTGDFSALPDGVQKLDFMQPRQSHCTCQERDNSYVCNHCYNLGRRGHCQQ